MNILYVTQALPYIPARDGFRLYAANLIRLLSRRHQIDLISFLRDDDERHLKWCKEYCSRVVVFPLRRSSPLIKPINFVSTYLFGRPLTHRREISNSMRSGLHWRQWDLIHVEGGYAGGVIPVNIPAPSVLSLHDSWNRRCVQLSECSPRWREKLYYSLLTFFEPRYERMVYPRFERCAVVANSEAEAVRSIVPRCDVAVIPNGVDTEYFRPMAVPKKTASMVFHGNMGYPPNVEAAVEFAGAIFPRIRKEVPCAVFHMVGAKPARQVEEVASLAGVELSRDLQDLRTTVSTGQIYVCPVRHGAGLKNKLLEAMALGLPVVTYPEGAAGIDCTHGKHLLMARDAEEFVSYVLELLRNPAKAAELASAGRMLAREEYSWESRAHAFEELYQAALDQYWKGVHRRGRLSRQGAGKIPARGFREVDGTLLDSPATTTST